jgi:beta-galactosidase
MSKNDFLFGVCYYPEHWELSEIDDDLRRMKAAQMNVVRVGEFSWATFEPEDGTYDSYPSFGELSKRGAGRGWNRPLSKVRGVSEKFLVLEQQTGPGGQLTYMTPAPEPGQIRLWTYQSIGNGAAGIVYFRWRTCTVGSEQLWHGILDYDSRPNRRYAEVQDIGEELTRVGPLLAKAAPSKRT